MGELHMKAEHLARNYYRSINAKDVEGVLSLFAEDAVFNLPDGRVVSGKDALRQMYMHVFAQGGPQPQPVNIVANEMHAAAQIEVTLADGAKLHMASFFAMGAGDTFNSVSVYERGR